MPSDIPKINDKLKSRPRSSLISNIEAPDYATRLKILRVKAKTNGYEVDDEIIQYLASELTEDVRQLESGLAGVMAKASLLCAPLDLNLAGSVVQNMVQHRRTSPWMPSSVWFANNTGFPPINWSPAPGNKPSCGQTDRHVSGPEVYRLDPPPDRQEFQPLPCHGHSLSGPHRTGDQGEPADSATGGISLPETGDGKILISSASP